MGEAGSKHVISTTQGDGMVNYIQHSKIYVQKVIFQYIGLVISRTKHFCVKITFYITKVNVLTLYVMTFLLVRSVPSNCSLSCTSPMRY